MAELKESMMAGLFGGAAEGIKNRDEPKTEAPDVEIEIDKLKDYHSELVKGRAHPWNRLSEEKKAELCESIKEHGLLQPIIVRPDKENGFYEILAGHNRRDALRACGITKLSERRGEIKIMRGTDLYDASDIMLDTNIQRDEVSTMEKAWACRIKLEIIRNKISVSQLGTGGRRSDEIAADELKMSRNNLQRYARLTYMIDDLQALANSPKVLPVNVGVEISYLSTDQQREIFSVWQERGKLPSIEQIKIIRSKAENEFLEADVLESLIFPTKNPEPAKLAFKNVAKKYKKLIGEKNDLINPEILEEILSEALEGYIAGL